MAKVSNKFALWLTIGRVLSMLVVFAMPLIMTRVLSQSDYGVFSQYFTLYTALNIIFALGFHSNLFYFYPTADEKGKDEYVSNTFFLLISMSVIAVILLTIPISKKLIFGDSSLSEYSGFVILSIALAIPMNIVSPLLTVREDRLGAIIYPCAAALLRVGVVTIAALIKNDLSIVFKALVFYQSLILLWISYYTFKKHKIHLNKNKALLQLQYSIPFGLTVALQIISNYYDKIISIRYLDSVQYAIYSAAFFSIPGINQIYDSLCQVNIVNMTRCYQEGSIQQVRELYKEFVVKTLSFSTPVILAVSLFSEEIISFLYPSGYIQSAVYFRIYSLTFLISMLGAGTILRAIGKTQYSLLSFFSSVVIGLPLTYYLIKLYSINGAIIGAVINLVLPRLFQMVFEAKHTNSKIVDYLAWGKIG